MSLTRRVFRRAPKVVKLPDGTVEPAPGQHSRLLRIKPLDVVYRRLVRRALKPLQTRGGQ